MWQSIGRATARAVRVGGPASSGRLAAATISRPAPTIIDNVYAPRASLIRAFATAKATTKSTTTAKKAAASKTKKATTGRTAAKAKKPVKKAATKKPVAKKPKKKVLKKKVLTEEEKQRAKIRRLRELALLSEQPGQLPDTAYLVFGQSFHKEGSNAAERAPEISRAFKALSQREVEALTTQAEENKKINQDKLAQWILTRTPDEIRRANLARRSLRNLKRPSKNQLKDARLPKRPTGAYTLYIVSRFKADFKGVPAPEALKRIAAEWNNLSESEKMPFIAENEAQKSRYAELARSVFGTEVKRSTSASASP